MQFTNNKEKGWEHLTDQEKSVITLIVVNERSKQEAALILNLAHYKFTEIYSRARKFFILFTDYYEKFQTLIPEGVAIDPKYLSLIHFLLKNRKSPATITSRVPDLRDLNSSRDRAMFWYELFNSLELDNPHHVAFKELLLEFDRWNSFRILPKDLSKPSPFQRRRNGSYKKLIDQLCSISFISWTIYENRYKTSAPPFLFVPVIIPMEGIWGVKKLKESPSLFNLLTANRIPLFSSEEEAHKFAEMVYDYKTLPKISPYMSHKFWANCRPIMSKALNFKILMNIEPGEYLDFSAKDKAFIAKAEMKKSKKISIKPTRDGLFYQ